MFEISDLKSKKLPELQEIAKGLNVPKFKTLKKLDLVYQILDLQASNPKAAAEVATVAPPEKPKRARVSQERPKEEKQENTPQNPSEHTKNDNQQRNTNSNQPRKDQQKSAPQHKNQGKKNPHHQKNGQDKRKFPYPKGNDGQNTWCAPYESRSLWEAWISSSTDYVALRNRWGHY